MTEARRGRPRSYDPDQALDAAIDVFWTHGYDAATLDQLSQAMGMGRPSLYGAFGDKQALFERAVRRFGERMATRAASGCPGGNSRGMLSKRVYSERSA